MVLERISRTAITRPRPERARNPASVPAIAVVWNLDLVLVATDQDPKVIEAYLGAECGG